MTDGRKKLCKLCKELYNIKEVKNYLKRSPVGKGQLCGTTVLNTKVR